MSTYGVSDDKLKAIADAIRLKTDNPAEMSVDDMPLQIGLIGGGSRKEEFELPTSCSTGQAFENALNNAGFTLENIFVLLKTPVSTSLTYQGFMYFKVPNGIIDLFGLGTSATQLFARRSQNAGTIDAFSVPQYAFACSAGDVFDVYTID